MDYSYRIDDFSGDVSDIMPLLLEGDESEVMISRYIDQCHIYAAFAGDAVVAVCAVMDNGCRGVEVKNLAVRRESRRQGIGHAMLRHVERCNPGRDISLGTGETPSTLRFYRSCGYEVSHVVRDFFTDNYPKPIIEDGVRLRHMIYLVKRCADRGLT